MRKAMTLWPGLVYEHSHCLVPVPVAAAVAVAAAAVPAVALVSAPAAALHARIRPTIPWTLLFEPVVVLLVSLGWVSEVAEVAAEVAEVAAGVVEVAVEVAVEVVEVAGVAGVAEDVAGVVVVAVDVQGSASVEEFELVDCAFVDDVVFVVLPLVAFDV